MTRQQNLGSVTTLFFLFLSEVEETRREEDKSRNNMNVLVGLTGSPVLLGYLVEAYHIDRHREKTPPYTINGNQRI